MSKYFPFDILINTLTFDTIYLLNLKNQFSIYTGTRPYYLPEECADEWWWNSADLKLLENCVMNGFIIFGIMFMTATGLEDSPQLFDVYPVSQSRSEVTSAENPTPDNSPQSVGELSNGHVANSQELLYQTGSKHGVIWNSDTCVNCVVS